MNKRKLLDDAELEMLSRANVEDWEYYYDVRDDVENGIDELDAMRGYGIDEWEGYDEAMSGFPEYYEYVSDTADPVSYTKWSI